MNNNWEGDIVKNTTWRKRRLKKGLSVSEVANYLDISYERYALIDKGKVKMPNKYIEKFNELLNKSKGERNINKMTREEIVNQWWKEMSEKSGHGKYKLNEKMHEFNIDNMTELDKLLGYSSMGATSGYLKKGESIGYDLKNKYYSFFENELNIQPPKSKKKSDNTNGKGVQKTNEYAELLEWYNNFDLKQWRDNHKHTNRELSKASGLATGTIHNVIKRNYTTPTIGVMRRLKDFVENQENETPKVVQMTLTQVPVDEVPTEIKRVGDELVKKVNENMTLKNKLLDKYSQEVDRVSMLITQYEILISDLKKEKNLYEQIINDINED